MKEKIIKKVMRKLSYTIPKIPEDLLEIQGKRDGLYLKYIKKLIESMGLDPMTGLFHKEHFEELDKGTGVYIMVDGDGLKKINDTYGHAAGSATILALAEGIKKSLRKKETPSRSGGDEFLIHIEDVSIATGLNIAKRILDNIHKENIADYYKGPEETKEKLKKIPLGASLGVGKTEAEADKALYKAKDKGRNRVEFFSPKKLH